MCTMIYHTENNYLIPHVEFHTLTNYKRFSAVQNYITNTIELGLRGRGGGEGSGGVD